MHVGQKSGTGLSDSGRDLSAPGINTRQGKPVRPGAPANGAGTVADRNPRVASASPSRATQIKNWVRGLKSPGTIPAGTPRRPSSTNSVPEMLARLGDVSQLSEGERELLLTQLEDAITTAPVASAVHNAIAGLSMQDIKLLHQILNSENLATRLPQLRPMVNYQAAEMRRSNPAQWYGLPERRLAQCARVPDGGAQMRPLGAGDVNTVFAATMQFPDGTSITGVFKAESEEVPEVALQAGISADRPLCSVRNEASWKLDQALHLNVTTPTHLAWHRGELGCVMEYAKGSPPSHRGNRVLKNLDANLVNALNANKGLLAEFAQNTKFFRGATIAGNEVTFVNERMVEMPDGAATLDKATSLSALDFTHDPILRREVTKLQWLDALTGQCDRHSGNYFVEYVELQPGAPPVPRLQAIDSDMCLGAGIDHPDQRAGKFSPRLPRVIDAATRMAFLEMDDRMIDAACEGLAPNETRSAKARLAVIKLELLKTGEGAVKVIDDNAWCSEEVSALLGVRPPPADNARPAVRNAFLDTAAETSYVAREAANLATASKMGIPVFAPDETLQQLQQLMDRAGPAVRSRR